MATREQILETSLHLFLQRGCKNLTMDEVASENGISKRTLYEMFKDKSSLLEESIISLHEKKRGMVTHYFERHENVLELLLDSMEKGDEKILDTHYQFMMEVKKYYPELHRRFIMTFQMNQYEMLKKLFYKGCEDGYFRKEGVDYDSLAYSLLVICNRTTDTTSFGDVRVNHQQAIMRTVVIILRGISTVKGIETIDNHIKNN